jgi:hypothetical protein
MRSGLHRLAFGLTPALLFLLGNTVSAAESAENLVEKGRVYEGKFQAKEALPLYQAAEKSWNQGIRTSSSSSHGSIDI